MAPAPGAPTVDQRGVARDANVDVGAFETTSRPSANDDSYATDQDTTLNVPAPGNLSNDTDSQGDPLSFRLIETTANGTLALNPQSSTNDTNLSLDASSDLQPSWSPDGQRIVFSSNRNGNYDIYSMNADGSNVVQLTSVAGSDTFPAFSPDGSSILFQSNRDGNYELYVMDEDGSNQTRLTNNSAADTGAGWSPDGSQVVFRSDRDGNDEIYAMDADGSNQTRLTNNSSSDTAPEWSPNGASIVFRSDRDGNGEIYLMDADGSNQTRLTNNSSAENDPDWSPDGSKIVFSSNRDGNNEIYVMDDDGTNQTRLTTNAASETGPVWSPDGSQVVFRSDRDGNAEVYVTDLLFDGAFTYAPDPGFTGVDTFTYVANDGAFESNQASVTITVNDVNEPPSDITLDNLTVDENAVGAVIGNLGVTDPDVGDTHSWSVNDARFEVLGTQLKLKAGQSLNFESEPTVLLVVTATDQGGTGLSYNKPFLITVNNVNEAPTDITLDNLNVAENAAGAVIGNLGVTDPDTGDTPQLERQRRAVRGRRHTVEVEGRPKPQLRERTHGQSDHHRHRPGGRWAQLQRTLCDHRQQRQ